MTMRKFDASLWNLTVPLGALAIGCGPLVPVDDGGDTDSDPTNSTNPSGPTDPSDPTNPTTNPTDPTGDQCPEVPCPYGYDCIGGVCQPWDYCEDYCCDDGYDDGCCYGEDGCCLDGGCWYDCYGLTECGYASFCEGYGYCNPIPLPAECGDFPDSSVALLIEGNATSLAFVNGNGDGARELAVVIDNTVQLVPGGGGPAAIVFTADTVVTDVAAGDLDADGDEDLALVAESGGIVLLNDGVGGFTLGAMLDSSGATEIDLGDFDGNGSTDLLLGYGGGIAPRVFVGLPGLAFQPASEFDVYSDTRDHAAGSIDSAMPSDVAIQDNDALQIWLGDGSPGGAAELQIFDNYGIYGTELVHLATGDFDGDGVDDIARTLFWNGWILVDSWQGDTLGEMDEWGYPLLPNALGSGDVNADGCQDLLIATDGFLGIRYGTTEFNGYELFGCFQSFGQVTGAWALATGDFDGDGDDDVAFVNGAGVSLFSRS